MNHLMTRTMPLVGLLAALTTVGPVPTAHAGAVGGPVHRVDRVSANSRVSYTINCRGGEWTNLLLRGDGDTDLDVFVYDRSGRLVASHTDDSDICFARWFSATTQTYTVVVRNWGPVYNQFVLMTD